MHIGMNMLSTASIGALIERRIGTLSYIMTCLWAIFATGILYCTIAVTLQVLIGKDDLMYQHSLGFSGIMFHLLVLESNMTPHASRSVFGFISVPSWAYSAVMLVVMQFMLPGKTSFTGHLCGILSGTMQLYGILDFVLVSDAFLQEMEQWAVLRPFTSKENFVGTPTTSSNTTTSGESQFRRDPKSLLRKIRVGVQLLLQFVWNVLETLQVAVFGRGRRANSNLHLDHQVRNFWATASSPSGNQAARDRSDDEADAASDEEWGGLPLIDGQERTQQSQIL